MFIDANIFLEIALKDEKSQDCQKFIKDAIKKKSLYYTSDFIVYSCLINIQYRLSSDSLRDFLVFLNSIKITILRPSVREIYDAQRIMEKYRLDFDDALVVSCMIANNIQELVSYDKHFDKVGFIKIIRP